MLRNCGKNKELWFDIRPVKGQYFLKHFAKLIKVIVKEQAYWPVNGTYTLMKLNV